MTRGQQSELAVLAKRRDSELVSMTRGQQSEVAVLAQGSGYSARR